MTITVRHRTQSAVPDSSTNGIIKPSHWNDNHDILMDTGRLLGRATGSPGATEEIEPDSTHLELVLASSVPTLRLKNSGATAGSYVNASITVDAKGRVTSISNGQDPSSYAALAQAAQAAAEAAQADAEAAQAAAEAALDDFDDIFLGSKAADPTLDNDGDPLVEGMLYWNSVSNDLRVYNGAYWENVTGLAAVVDDTSPQLGGDLDLNGFNVTGIGNVNITGNVSVTDDAYAAGWNGSANVPTKNAVYDKIELVLGTTLPATYQPLDADLTAIAALSPSNDDIVQRKAGAWTNRTMAQLIADLAALGTTFQPLDADLTTLGGLAKTDGNFIVGDGSTWVVESGSTARTSLGLGTAAVKNTGTSGDAVPLLNIANAWSGRQSSTGAVTGNNAMNVATGSLGEFEVTGNGTGAAMMAFHRPGVFAAYLGLDTDNVWKVGGWSMGATASAIAHAGNLDDTLEYSGSSTFQRAALTGDVTASAGSNSTTIANDAVTYAKMQNVSATSRVLGRKTSGAGDTEECTLSEVLDFIGSAAQGDILYRGASAWARLGAGTSGQFLKTLGAGANPAWDTVSGAGGLALLTSGTVSSAATLDIVLTSYTTYRGLKLILMGFVPATDGTDLFLRTSTDGGSTYDAGASDYNWGNQNWVNGSIGGDGDAADNEITLNRANTAGQHVSNVASEGGWSGVIELLGQTETGRNFGVQFMSRYAGDGASTYCGAMGHGVRLTSADVDAVRLLFSSGNITSGKWALYGYA